MRRAVYRVYTVLYAKLSAVHILFSVLGAESDNQSIYCSLFQAICCILFSVLGAESGIHERRLLADLLEHYNKLERPVQE